MSGAQPTVRLAELVATLSLGTDLGLGQPMEHVIRLTLLALRMGERLDLSPDERTVVYYAGLLAWVGCHTDAYEQAKWLGDDIAAKANARLTDHVGIGDLVQQVGAGKAPFERVRIALALLGTGMRDLNNMIENHLVAAGDLARRLGLGQDVCQSISESYERWDGRGPLRATGEQILITSRLLQLADVVTFFHRSWGVEAAIAVARDRRGTQFDPALVDLLCGDAAALLHDLDRDSNWEAVIAAEPQLSRLMPAGKLDDTLEAISDFADLKSPYTLGHSRGVADLAAAAARIYGLSDAAVLLLRRAALVHDVGRLGVSNAIWDKRGPLTQSELERVRLHPYLGERMLAFSAALSPLSAIAVQHHERLDGSGYPRGLSGHAITPEGRLLAAADVYHAMTELRPHRPALSVTEAAAQLRAEVTAGRLDGDVVSAVLRAAGHRVAVRREWPASLTAREVEVLRLLARGLSNKQIAEQLVITRKTAGNHVEHVYAKIGVSNRARASLFAIQHGLMLDTQIDSD